jgi:CMP-N-acetylneuraminic acid synthetase
MKIIAVIHAKGESERLPNKNLMELGGLPLIAHSIINARNSIANKVVIDSDDSEILEVGTAFGAEPLKRPPYLARNEITGDDLAYWQAQNFPDYDIIVQVVPTSPFTKPETINKCIEYVQLGCNSAFTATSEDLYTWSSHAEDGEFLPDYYNRMGKLMNSNELIPTLVEHTGVYAFKTKFAFKQRRRIDVASFRTVPISYIEKIDINTEEDFQFAEVVWQGLNLSSP